VQGFGGMRTDGERLSFAPSIPKNWNSYGFKVLYHGALIEVNVDKSTASFKVIEGPDVTVDVYGNAEKITRAGVSLRLACC
jgi:maltose phosphorylase